MSERDKPDESPVDPLPALLADVDQALMMVPTLARWAKALFDGFVAEGFSEQQALFLTANQIKTT